MSALMGQASVPVLRDIVVKGLEKCEVYPFPVPDLFQGSPLTIAGKFEIGAFQFNQQCIIEGTLWDGTVMQLPYLPNTTERIPVNKVFLKQRIDVLTAQQWLKDDEKLEKEIIELSTQENFPSKFTTMVAYETTEKQKDELKDKKKRGPLSGKAIAALAVGGSVVAIGASLFVFGDVGATVLNTVSGAVEGLGDVFGGDIDVDCCCDGCGDCGCDQILESLSCGVCDSCGGVWDALTCGILDCEGDGDCCDCGGCLEILGNICDGCGDICDGLGGFED